MFLLIFKNIYASSSQLLTRTADLYRYTYTANLYTTDQLIVQLQHCRAFTQLEFKVRPAILGTAGLASLWEFIVRAGV